LAELAGGRSTAETALVWDWENWWAVEGAAHPLNNYSYRQVAAAHYQSLWQANTTVDVVTLSSDLSRYKVLVIPNQYLMSAAQQAAVRSFVDGGGHVLISYFSGIVDEDDQILGNGYPGGLRGVIGAHIRDFSPLAPGEEVGLAPVPGQALLSGGLMRFDDGASRWQDDLALEGADAVAVYTEGYLAGRPAILDHRAGSGSTVYIGTHLPQDTLDGVVEAVLARAGIRPAHPAPRGVEVTERFNDAGRYLFFLNHTGAAAAVDLEVSGTELLSGQQVGRGGSLKLEPAGVAVVRISRGGGNPDAGTGRGGGGPDQPWRGES
jgi:beta-galactosidase